MMIVGKSIEYSVDQDEYNRIEGTPLPLQPLSLYVVPSSRCFLNCIYCFAANRPSEQFHFTEFLSVLDIIAPWFPMRIVVTGGEPLAEQHTAKLVSELRKRGLSVTLATSLIGKVSALSIASEIDWFDVSVPATRQDVYQELRRGGNVREVMRTIRELSSAGARVRASVPLFPLAIRHLRETVLDLLEVGAERVKLQAAILSPGMDIQISQCEDAYKRIREDLLVNERVLGPLNATVRHGWLDGYLYLQSDGWLAKYSTSGEKQLVARAEDIVGREAESSALQVSVAAQLKMFRVGNALPKNDNTG